jgi:transcription factor SPN1
VSSCHLVSQNPLPAGLEDSDSDDDDIPDAGAKPNAESEDEAAGLFDSDDSDDDDEAAAAAAAAKKKAAAKKMKKLSKKSAGDGDKKGKKAKRERGGSKKKRKRGGSGSDSDSDDDEPGRKLSKKEKMEALRAKKRAAEGGDTKPSAVVAPGDDTGEKKRPEEDGYDSGDSYGSETFVRTKEDDDFIDAEGEDPDALRELYAEQHFDDERGDGTDSEDERARKKGGKGSGKGRKKGPDALSDDELNGDEIPDNPIMAAVHKMKKKKKKPKKLSELEDEAKEFLTRMQMAADDDDVAVKEKRPATNKLAMLNETLDLLARKDLTRPLLDMDLLMVAAAWVRPLPNGQLGNVTVRSKLLQAIGQMSGENGITAGDLKRSNFGKVVMQLYMHKQETRDLKRQHKALIEQWSRPIFQKSGNMRDLEKVQESRGASGTGGIAGIARVQAMARSRGAAEAGGSAAAAAVGVPDDGRSKDLSAIIARGSESTRDLGNNRVRVPFSKGFQYSVRPTAKTGNVQDKRTYVTSVKDNREALHKKMLGKSRPVSKNQRSANISIEGRPTK